MAPTVSEQLTLLTVNGHPDDETAETGGVIARYAAEGKRVICVAATRGEVGMIVDPRLATPDNRAHLGELREHELARALAALGHVEYRFLDYRDSGMAGTTENADARSFWRADLDEAVGRLVRIIREARADVLVSPNRFGIDGHPDHIRAAEVARLAFERAGDPGAYPEQLEQGLESWAPAKLYEVVHAFGRREKISRAREAGGVVAVLPLIVRAGVRWRPGRERARLRMMAAQRAPTTRVDVGSYLEPRRTALAEYRSQLSRDSELLVLTPDYLRRVHPTEDFALVAARSPITLPEDDLFAGIPARLAPTSAGARP